MITSAITVLRPSAPGVAPGTALPAGPAGPSAYQLAGGDVVWGSLAQWQASLVGPAATAAQVAAAVAALAIGPGHGQIAAGDDSRIVGAIQAAGGDASAATVLPSSGFKPVSLGQIARSLVLLSSLGFVGDGASHPLSATFATVAAAQAVFPRAQALTEEIDGHAIQRMIDLGSTVVALPDNCSARTSRTILSGAAATSLKGRQSAIVQVTAGADGWHHGTADTGHQAVYFASFRVEGVSIQCLGIGGRAIDVQLNPASGGWAMRDVLISGAGNQTQNYWGIGAARGTCCAITTFRDVSAVGCNGGNLANANDAFVFTNDTATFPNSGSAIYVMDNVNVGWYRYAYRSDINNPLEGWWISKGNVNNTMGVLQTNNSVYPANSYRAPQYFVTGLQAECYGTYFDLGGVKYVKIRGCLFIVDGPVSGIASPADYSWDLIAIRGSSYGVEISDNDIELLPTCKPRYLLNADGAAGLVTYTGNRHYINSGAAATAVVNFGASGNGLSECREYDNRGLSGLSWAIAAGTADRTNKNFSEASILQRLAAAGQGDHLVAINHENGEATVRGSRAANVASGQVVVALPGGVLAAVGELQAGFGDTVYVASGELPVPVLSAATTTSLPIQILNYSGSNPRRVNFSVTG